ncbi:MAG: alpha-amylase family glycosyl hydrolase [Paludibacter sp.]|nr:alpha-amylase family glycosyl hydrolase [Paludibacter sp.]
MLAFIFFGVCLSEVTSTVIHQPPHWAKSAIWYQIFVERFNNGDVTNDQKPENTMVTNMNIIPPADWKTSSWTSDWFKRDIWMQNSEKSFNDLLQYRRYGGDLQGVIDKLDYLTELGITAIYLNPINDAPSLHKYDARNYHHVDINFGTDPEGDLKIMATENPADPSTWKWTSADKLFLKLIDEAHKRGIRVIMDYSWNHTGTLFWAWLDILKNQADSKYKDWYNISTFDNPATPQNEFKYDGWYGNAYMPEFRKTDVKTERMNGKPYEGNIDAGAKQHIFEVTKRWLAPDGDMTKGVDGYRLDVAEQIGLAFWRDYRKFVRSVKEDAYLVGEIWWEKWPDILMDPTRYMNGDMFDAVMYYQVYRPARYFFAKTKNGIDARQLKDSLSNQWNKLKPEFVKAMMNVSSSHDAPRLLTDFFNDNDYKFHANPIENTQYKTGKPDKESYKRLQLYLIHLFTTIGAPHIWNGEEMGMWGADDPFGRKPLWWKEMKFEPENRNNIQPLKPVYDKVGFDQQTFLFYKKLIQIRKQQPILIDGELEFLVAENKQLAYRRYDESDEIFVLFNLENTNRTFKLPNQNYIDLITEKKYQGNQIVLGKLTGVVLKKIK